MRELYFSLLRRAYAWSAKNEFDGQSSLFSAVLYISALQLLNLLALVFLSEALWFLKIEMSRWIAAIVPIALFATNWIIASRYASRIDEKEIASDKFYDRVATAYVVVSIVAFLIATVAFVYTGP